MFGCTLFCCGPPPFAVLLRGVTLITFALTLRAFDQCCFLANPTSAGESSADSSVESPLSRLAIVESNRAKPLRLGSLFAALFEGAGSESAHTSCACSAML